MKIPIQIPGLLIHYPQAVGKHLKKKSVKIPTIKALWLLKQFRLRRSMRRSNLQALTIEFTYLLPP